MIPLSSGGRERRKPIRRKIPRYLVRGRRQRFLTGPIYRSDHGLRTPAEASSLLVSCSLTTRARLIHTLAAARRANLKHNRLRQVFANEREPTPALQQVEIVGIERGAHQRVVDHWALCFWVE